MRRFGGVPPVVTVLVAIAAIVAAGLVAYFIYSTTVTAARQPSVTVTDAYASCPPGTTGTCIVVITLRNTGAVDLSSVSASLFTRLSTSPYSGTCSPSTLNRGGTINCRFTGVPVTLADGEQAILRITATPSGGSGSISFDLSVRIARP